MSWLKDVIGYGTHAERPAAGSQGRLYYETDTATLWRDSGTLWVALPFGGSSGTSHGPSAAAYSAVPITLSSGANTALPLDTTEYDQDVPSGAMQHDTTSAPTRLTCQVAGVYALAVFVGFASNPSGSRYVSARKNGTTFLFEDGRPALTTDVTEFALSGQFPLMVGDYVETLAYQDSGGNLNLRTDADLHPRMAWARVG